MPTTPTYPGVYVEEVPSQVRTIAGVSTSVTAFVGYFRRGPLNAPVRILNLGDFEREFGGLHRDSAASYAIRQFFANGGTEAWVVRVAETDPASDPAVTASLELNDASSARVLEVRAGRRVRGKSVDDPGAWGNNLRLEVDYNTPRPATSFNLTISETTDDGRTVLRTETFRDLSMTASDPRYAPEVVNERSKLIQLYWQDGDSTNRPVATGTLGSAIAELTAAEIPDQGTPINAGGAGDVVDYGPGGKPADVDLPTLRPYLQAAIRRAGVEAGDSLYAGAVVELLRTDDGASPYRFRVVAGRAAGGLEPSAVLVFSGAAAVAVGLDAGTNNVQQYRLGTDSALAFDGGTDLEGVDGSPPGAAALRGSYDAKTGIYALRDVDLFNILCIPRAADLDDAGAMRSLVGEALDFCEKRRAMLILDVPEEVDEVPRMETWMEQNATLRRENAAVYFPRPRIADPLNDFRLKSVGASGTIAGLWARTDAERGVWKAPAGTEAALSGVQELACPLTDGENGVLNPLGINCLRTFPVYGNVCWGARTLMGANVQASQWKYVPVRRLALYVEESLYRGTQWVVFEPNDEPLWSQIRLNVGAFMNRLFRQGAFQGQSPRDAYFVKCDAETTTQDDVDQGIVNVLVGFAPLKPAEFVIIKISQIAGQIPT